ncbi:adenylyltransferase/sulfurtransferase MoeZ [Microbacterium pseudoresistens]|uniref:Adenylyltransferase/sulfurtransferase n=1 Tax=Microbacterium pseudoresistens TaxID=640634 RepID=A0A7Y9EVG9_9MICO|nr:ThiF family adenylyltransferase [Microbacterium pseudoresistens]NYD54690.1 adenylyltransferase/sulfurtransferase [Microbacterium pseudoresistens]
MEPLVDPGPALSPERITRYSRQLMLPGFGEEAQRRLRNARVLVIGAGGLGSATVPVLAGAGVGTIGIVDDDAVELSNLHRQLSHGVADIGRAKVDSLADTVRALDPECRVITHPERLTSQNLPGILADYDLLVDGSDNFPTRYLANDAAELAGIPLVWGAILRFHGQAGIAWRAHGPTYRDLFPSPPPPDEALSCELGGVLPSLCTAVGSFLATEVIKLVTGIGDPLIGRVLVYDALTARTREIAYAPDEDADPITGLIDYDLFCGVTPDEPAEDALSAAELLQRMRAGEEVVLLDVREPHEARARRIEGSALLPVGRIDAGEMPDVEGSMVVYCEQDPRSRRAVRALRERGIDAVYLTGGIRAFAEVGGPVVEGDRSPHPPM